MCVGTNARRRRHRITKMNLTKLGAFDKLDESLLKCDCCENVNETIIVVRITSSVILSLLLISFNGNKLWSMICTKVGVFKLRHCENFLKSQQF